MRRRVIAALAAAAFVRTASALIDAGHASGGLGEVIRWYPFRPLATSAALVALVAAWLAAQSMRDTPDHALRAERLAGLSAVFSGAVAASAAVPIVATSPVRAIDAVGAVGVGVTLILAGVATTVAGVHVLRARMDRLREENPE